MPRHRHVMNRDEVAWTETVHGARFAYKNKRLGAATSARGLGCGLFMVPPGKTAFPHHVHHGVEEAIYVLSGQGTLRLDGERIPVSAGDYIALPPGGPAHQLINTAAEPLEYLCVSTLVSPEVVEYPDSAKIGTRAGTLEKPLLRALFKKAQSVDYYEGEE